MKFKTSYLILLFTILFATAASAQVDRRIGRGQYKRAKKEPQKVDLVEQSTEYLAKELTLDDFQKAAARNVIAGEKDAIMLVNEDREMLSDVKRDKMKEISTRIYNKIVPLLSTEQAEKYKKLEETKKY